MSVPSQARPNSEAFPGFFFRVPDDIDFLMSMKDRELRVYLAILQSFRATNPGYVSVRELARRTRLALRHAHEAAQHLCAINALTAFKRDRRVTVYGIPFTWRGGNCIPTGEQSGSNCAPTGIQARFPVGAQRCFPVGKRNIEFREEREKPQLPHERGEVVEVERYGQTLAAVGEVDPGAGLDFIGRLLKAVSDAGLSPVGDERLAWAIRKSEETTRGQHGAGLLLKRVPVVLATKARAEERARVAQVAEASRVASEAWIWREEMRALAEDPLAAEEDRMLARKALGA